MLEKIVGVKIELKPKTPKENERLCDTCGGVGWLYNKERSCIEVCRECYNGIITLCPGCGQPVRGLCMNKECRKRRDAEKEKKHLEKAIRVKYEDIPDESKQMLYSDVYPYNEGYFTNIKDFIEYCIDNDIPVPSYVWSTQKIELSMDAGSIIENACEELHEDAMDNIVGEKELQEFLDAWCAKQTGTDTYMVDYEYAIEISGA